ncbi:MAG TPA: hypothetical protein VJ824_10085 [Bacillota bacterium]|nr:hypothetical protein [Bacillota bacterium]
MQSSVNQQVSSVPNQSQVEELNHWNSQPVWIKSIVKVWIALEFGWYVGWVLHIMNLL